MSISLNCERVFCTFCTSQPWYKKKHPSKQRCILTVTSQLFWFRHSEQSTDVSDRSEGTKCLFGCKISQIPVCHSSWRPCERKEATSFSFSSALVPLLSSFPLSNGLHFIVNAGSLCGRPRSIGLSGRAACALNQPGWAEVGKTTVPAAGAGLPGQIHPWSVYLAAIKTVGRLLQGLYIACLMETDALDTFWQFLCWIKTSFLKFFACLSTNYDSKF